MKKILFILVALSFSVSLLAQRKENAKRDKKEEKRKRIDALIKQEEEGVIAYKKQTVYGAKLTSDGYGGFFEIGRGKSVKKAMLYQFEITERKHPKEYKRFSAGLPRTPFAYGKLNFFYPIKIGVQQQFLFGNKSNKNGVSVTGNIGGGLIIGLLRPYEVQVDKGSERVYVRYNSPDSLLFINADNPSSNTSGPSFGTGWKHLKVTPGVYIKPALRFDYGRLNEIVSALEIGVNAEFYAKKIPQMLYNKEKQFFLSAYVALLFGKRK
jgi:hypothetical protein